MLKYLTHSHIKSIVMHSGGAMLPYVMFTLVSRSEGNFRWRGTKSGRGVYRFHDSFHDLSRAAGLSGSLESKAGARAAGDAIPGEISRSNLSPLCSRRFYSSPYSISTNRMIAQASITPFIAASPVSTYQVSGAVWNVREEANRN